MIRARMLLANGLPVCRLSNIVLTEAALKSGHGRPIIAAGRQIGTKQSSQRQLQVQIIDSCG